jgi:PAS domain S-box-containing protein
MPLKLFWFTLHQIFTIGMNRCGMVQRIVRLSQLRLQRQNWSTILLALLLLLSSAAESAAQPLDEKKPKRVLIFSSHDPASPGSVMVTQNIRSALFNSRLSLQFYQESLDISLLRENRYEEMMVSLLRQKYAGEQIDLIIGLGAPALKFLFKHRADLFPQAPIVYFYFDETEAFAQHLRPNATGIWGIPDFRKTLEIALSLHPDTQTVTVVAGDSRQDQFLRSAARKDFRAYEDRFAFDYPSELTLEELRLKLSALPQKSLIIYLSFFLDREGKIYSGPQALSLVAPYASAPIYGISTTYGGAGIVGGSLLDFEGVGKEVGDLALRVLSGEKADDLMPRVAPSVTLFDADSLKRWGISRNLLPPGSRIQRDEPVFWDRYQAYLLAAFTACLLIALLATGLLRRRARRRKDEAASRRLEQQSAAERSKLEEIVASLPGIIWEARTEPSGTALRVQFISKYIEELLGYGVEEWLTAPALIYSVLPEEDLKEFMRRRNLILVNGQRGSMQYRWKAKDGRLLWALAHVTPIVDEAGAVVGLRGVTLDITERKLAEEKLKRANQDLRRFNEQLHALNEQLDKHQTERKEAHQVLQEAYQELREKINETAQKSNDLRNIFSTGVPILFLDRHLRIKRYTPQMEGLFNITREDIDRPVADLSHNLLATSLGEAALQVLADLQTIEREVHSRDDHYYLMRLQPYRTEEDLIDGVMVMFIDITERKLTEQMLNQSQARLLLAQTAARVGTWEWNLTTGESIWSEGIYELLGLAQGDENVTVEDFIAYIHPDDVSQTLGKVESVLQNGEDYYYHEFRVIRSDGVTLWLMSRGRVVRDASGKAEWMIGINTDITERKVAEEALRQSERRNLDIVRALPDLMFVHSSQGDYLDYYAKDINDLYLPPEAFLGKNLCEVLPADLADSFIDCFRRARQTGEVQVHEYRMVINHEPQWFEARIIYTVNDQFLSIVRNVSERRRAEADLSESEERFRNMANTAPVMIWVSSPDKHYSWFNKQWFAFMGRGLEEEIGDSWIENIQPEHQDGYILAYGTAFDLRKPFSLMYQLRRYDGEYRWVFHGGTPRLSMDGNFLGYIGSCIDVTDSMVAETAARESQVQLAEIIGSAMDAIITLGRSLRILHFNSAAEQMFGCPALEAIGQPIERFIPAGFLEFLQSAVQDLRDPALAEAPIGTSRAIYGRRSNGEEFPAEASISQTELSGQTFSTIILRDITERRKAEDALRVSEANYRAIINGINAAIFVLDKESGAILDVNQRMCEMYGVTLEEARSLPVSELSASESADGGEAALQRIRKAGAGEPQLFEWRGRDRTGRVFWVEVSLKPITLEGQERVLAMMLDITPRKRAEEAREAAFAQVSELKSQLEAENIYLKGEIRLEHNFNEIVGTTEAIRKVLLKIEQISGMDTTVLILGETGTGKELIANAIHSTSLRSDKPLIKVNCAALPATLIESELFGHERGAFTSAMTQQLGRFELANGGTLLLDEIGDLPLELQGKLLRVLEEGEFERLGSGKTIRVNVRIIAATNRNLLMDVQKGLFREDLWYRLNIFPITVPPLRERKEDIPLLVEAFVEKFSKELKKTIKAITPATMKALLDYSWPGNIRELANVIERAMINTEGTVLRLADQLERPAAIGFSSARQTLEDLEKQYILQVLVTTEWRIEGPKGAAQILGLNPSTLRTRMAKLRIQKSPASPDVKHPSQP